MTEQYIRPCELTLEDETVIGLARRADDEHVMVVIFRMAMSEAMANRYPDAKICLQVVLLESDVHFCWLEIGNRGFCKLLAHMKNLEMEKLGQDAGLLGVLEPMKWYVTYHGFQHINRNFSPPLELGFEDGEPVRVIGHPSITDQAILTLLDVPVLMVADNQYPIRLEHYAMDTEWQIVNLKAGVSDD